MRGSAQQFSDIRSTGLNANAVSDQFAQKSSAGSINERESCQVQPRKCRPVRRRAQLADLIDPGSEQLPLQLEGGSSAASGTSRNFQHVLRFSLCCGRQGQGERHAVGSKIFRGCTQVKSARRLVASEPGRARGACRTAGRLAPTGFRGAYDGSWATRARPSFFIRLRSVLGCSPRMVAAPRAPSMTHFVLSRTSRM